VTYLLAAKLVVAAHVLFVVFVFLGGLSLPSHRWLVWVHAPCLAYALLISVVGWPCPLTLVEQWLLELARSPVYSGEFLPHYVWSRVGLTGAEPLVAGGMVAALLVCNFMPYRAFFRLIPAD
jgi:uncharacterized membrane protein